MPSPDELVSRVREVIDAVNSGDFDRAVQKAHPDIVFVRLAGQPDLRGRDAMRTWMEPDAFESMSYENVEFETAGNRVLVSAHARGRGAGSGIEMEADTFAVWTFDEQGMITRVQAFLSHEEKAARRAFSA